MQTLLATEVALAPVNSILDAVGPSYVPDKQDWKDAKRMVEVAEKLADINENLITSKEAHEIVAKELWRIAKDRAGKTGSVVDDLETIYDNVRTMENLHYSLPQAQRSVRNGMHTLLKELKKTRELSERAALSIDYLNQIRQAIDERCTKPSAVPIRAPASDNFCKREIAYFEDMLRSEGSVCSSPDQVRTLTQCGYRQPRYCSDCAEGWGCY